MPDIETPKPGDWIRIGSVRAVVCGTPMTADPMRVEVVYLDDRDRAINEDAHYVEGSWRFVHDGPVGGYADNYDRLAPYVAKLRAGQK